MTPESWRWVWLVATVVFALGEMATAGSFFLLPFAIGAALASGLAFAGVDVAWTWAGFVGVSAVSLASLRTVARRTDKPPAIDGVGARRLIGQMATVTDDVEAGPNGGGTVKVGAEEWRAQSSDGDRIPRGTVVKIIEVRGTRVVVWPMGRPTE